jgi:hypothetical protein
MRRKNSLSHGLSEEGQALPEDVLVLGVFTSSAAFLFTELGARALVGLTAPAGLLP